MLSHVTAVRTGDAWRKDLKYATSSAPKMSGGHRVDDKRSVHRGNVDGNAQRGSHNAETAMPNPHSTWL